MDSISIDEPEDCVKRDIDAVDMIELAPVASDDEDELETACRIYVLLLVEETARVDCIGIDELEDSGEEGSIEGVDAAELAPEANGLAVPEYVLWVDGDDDVE